MFHTKLHSAHRGSSSSGMSVSISEREYSALGSNLDHVASEDERGGALRVHRLMKRAVVSARFSAPNLRI